MMMELWRKKTTNVYADKRLPKSEANDQSKIKNHSNLYILDPLDSDTIVNKMQKDTVAEEFSNIISVYDRLRIRVGPLAISPNISFAFITSLLCMIVNILNDKSPKEWRALQALWRLTRSQWNYTPSDNSETQRLANILDSLEIRLSSARQVYPIHLDPTLQLYRFEFARHLPFYPHALEFRFPQR
jgi:hypothetical protein